MDSVRLMMGDCIEKMAEIEDGSVDAVICDPIYPEINRSYGRISEADWHVLMRGVVEHSRRILKPSGSAVFILQPNYEKIGKTRLWLWEFIVDAGRSWNLVEDAYWWNFAALPNAGCERNNGLLRRSIKPCVWLGSPDCYRNQEEVLWTESDANRARRSRDRAGRVERPSGNGVDDHRACSASVQRGGVTPFNLIPIANTDSTNGAGSQGHGAGTPKPLCDWWVKYISPPGGVVCDPFMGSGTTGLSAIGLGRSYIGIEQNQGFFDLARERIAGAASSVETPLFDMATISA